MPLLTHSVGDGILFLGCPIHWIIRSVIYCYHDISNWLGTFTSRHILRSKVKVTAGCWGQIWWTPYLMNYLSNVDETYRNNQQPYYWWHFGGQSSRSQQV